MQPICASLNNVEKQHWFSETSIQHRPAVQFKRRQCILRLRIKADLEHCHATTMRLIPACLAPVYTGVVKVINGVKTKDGVAAALAQMGLQPTPDKEE